MLQKNVPAAARQYSLQKDVFNIRAAVREKEPQAGLCKA
jgi:hypothetical protein